MTSVAVIKRLMRERPHLREPLQFYRRVCELWSSATPDDLTGALVPLEERPLRLAKGLPLLDPQRVATIDLTHTEETLTRLLALLRARNPALARVSDILNGALGHGRERARALARWITGQDASLPTDVPREFAAYAVRLALRPSLTALLPALRETFSERAWNRPLCPLCGFPPALAEERDRDRRFFCSLCPADWIYTVRGCPFCGNASEQHLACAVEDVEPGYHIAICTQCRGYLKTGHPHEMGREIDAPLEDLLTVPLDHAAQRDGYRPPVETAAAVASVSSIR